MKFRVDITETAKNDMIEAAEYIDYVLKNPQAADNLIEAIEKEIGSLAIFPERYAVLDDSVLSFFNVRFVRVKDYLAFYVTMEDERLVVILRFLHMRRDWTEILKVDMLV
ncbi:MAG TPA: type II toxin-antitoxin system RelE/ParE family toxin [Candidatus Avanaerovorax faecigallinarum]|nr:type II toxin-antitoxin system RelE/ParE family toxin [Candidatus Avanaerovorax faecigallinarum]